MSTAQSDENLLEGGVGLSPGAFAESLAFNGQCFLMNAAQQLANAPEFIGLDDDPLKLVVDRPLGAGDAADKYIEGEGTAAQNPIAGRADETHGGDNSSLPGISTGPGGQRRGRMQRYQVEAPGDARSPFAPIIPVRGDTTQTPVAFNSLAPNRSQSDILMKLTPATLGQLVPYIRLYKVEYGIKYDPVAPDTPMPDTSKARDIEIKFDKFVSDEAFGEGGILKTGRLSGVGIKKFRWQLRGVNPAEADRNIEAQLELHFNSVDQVFMTQEGRLSRKVIGGEASVLDLIVMSPPIVETEGPHGYNPSLSVFEEQPDNSNPHLIYDGKFFEIKAVVGWDLPPSYPGVVDVRNLFAKDLGLSSAERRKLDLTEIADGLKTVLYLTLTDHRFNFNQDGSADLVVNYRARTAMKEMKDDVTGGGRQQFLIDRIQKLEKAGVDELPIPADAQGNPKPPSLPGEQLKKAEDELLEFETTRYSDIVKKIPKYIAWARPEQLKVFRQAHEDDTTPSAATSRDVVHGMSGNGSVYGGHSGAMSGTGFASGDGADEWDYDNSGNPVPTDDPAGYLTSPTSGRGTQAGDIAYGEDDVKDIHGGRGQLGIDPGTGDWENSSVGRGFLKDKKSIENYFKLDAIEPYDNPWYPMARKSSNKLTPRQSPPGKINNVTTNMLNEDFDTDDRQELELRHVNSTFATMSATARSELTSTKEDTERRKHIPVVFFYLGDLIWQLIEHTTGVKEEVQKKNLGIMTLDLLLPRPEKIHTKMLQVGTSATAAKELKFGWHSLSDSELKEMLYRLNISVLPIQLDMFLQWMQRKIIKAGRVVYFFEDFLIDLIRDLVNPILGTACLPGVPNFKTSISCVSLITDRKSPMVEDHMTWSESTGWTSPSKEHPTRVHGDSAKMISGAALNAFATSNKNTLSPGVIAFDPEAPKGEEQKHTTFKVIMPIAQPIRRKGHPAADAAAGVWHFKVGDNRGPVMKITFDRTDIPMAREARTHKTRSADIWQLRELYNTSIRLVGFPGIIPGQTIYVTPNMHMFGDPRHEASVARVLGLGGYHIVVSTDNEITPAGYTTTIRALHEALPSLEQRPGYGADSSVTPTIGRTDLRGHGGNVG